MNRLRRQLWSVGQRIVAVSLSEQEVQVALIVPLMVLYSVKAHQCRVVRCNAHTTLFSFQRRRRATSTPPNPETRQCLHRAARRKQVMRSSDERPPGSQTETPLPCFFFFLFFCFFFLPSSLTSPLLVFTRADTFGERAGGGRDNQRVEENARADGNAAQLKTLTVHMEGIEPF